MTPGAAEETGAARRGPLAAAEWALARLVAAALFAMMLLTFVDVGGRYLFNAPLPGAFELTELAMGVLVFATFPLLVRPEAHISIDIAIAQLPRPLRGLQRIAASVFSALVLAVLAWRLALLAAAEAEVGYTTFALRVPTWPFPAAMAGLAGLAALLSLAVALRLIRDGGRGL